VTAHTTQQDLDTDTDKHVWKCSWDSSNTDSHTSVTVEVANWIDRQHRVVPTDLQLPTTDNHGSFPRPPCAIEREAPVEILSISLREKSVHCARVANTNQPRLAGRDDTLAARNFEQHNTHYPKHHSTAC
jgi:hypothetical protein